MICSTTSSTLDHADIIRRLQDDVTRSRTVLTILYLCVLGLCFVVPVFYYFRMHCEERHARRMRELEMAGMREALEQSEQNREESRAVRRKYREERRARIVQLFDPVRIVSLHFIATVFLVDSSRIYKLIPQRNLLTVRTNALHSQILKEEHFPHLQGQPVQLHVPSGNDTTMVEPVGPVDPDKEGSEPDVETGGGPTRINVDVTKPSDGSSDEDIGEWTKPTKKHVVIDDTTDEDEPPPEQAPSESRHEFADEETTFIRIPKPGLNILPSVDEGSDQLRLVESLCSICLCNYEVGSDIVWSSNSACDHVFHESCIEQWIMKQREGPLCPCCRRDFVIDPYDFEEEAIETPIILLGDFSDIENAGNTTQIVSLAEFPADTTTDNDASSNAMASSSANNTSSQEGQSEEDVTADNLNHNGSEGSNGNDNEGDSEDENSGNNNDGNGGQSV